MPRRQTARNLPRAGKIGPIKPGSVLYRMLEMIAREVARAWEAQCSANDQRQAAPPAEPVRANLVEDL